MNEHSNHTESKEEDKLALALTSRKSCSRWLQHHLSHFASQAGKMTTPPEIPAAPWRKHFLEHVSKMDDPFMSVSTVAVDEKTRRFVPRVRTCGFRGFFGELKLHPSAMDKLGKTNEPNHSIYESDMITFTTDARMGKVEQLNRTGGAIEVVFWVKEVMGQWRFRGKAFVIGGDENKKSEKDARAEIWKGLRPRPDIDSADWPWEKEVTAYFANHSPVLRGSFKGPHPGTPCKKPHDNKKPDNPELKLGQKVEDLHDPLARENFRVVVMRVEEVDRLDLNDLARPKRWRTKLDHTGQEHWEEEVELWP